MHERVFKLWYYTVSHRQMLLRSIGTKEKCNMDIYFGDVLYIEIPTKINAIEILQTSQADIDYIAQRIGNTNETITVLSSESRKYYVVSSVVKVLENGLDMFDLPFDIPNYRGKCNINNSNFVLE